ncbi:hypothetical protein FCR2A7T_25980 [Flavobacterium cauense R2A-7]|uniref:Uncharacterized protein n=1 Tax=Flavobacterium cauense R2A-7 TaxID=1341154 RepID=V6S499_9FLAO|nr:hypothetical protein [Flavobacterium cauense]ESU19175.1 hypothetical protein FCR2A7T_25980 [Flavobacterium cauense R2A-7]TWI15154.1 hypothetical protein IP98_00142 [Flavobacterium cauense R2A-7]
MKSEITQQEVTDFWIRVYFDTTSGLEIAAIKRAYRDLSRTLINFPKDENKKSSFREKWLIALLPKIEEVRSKEFIDFVEFTIWHQSACYALRTANDEYHLTQGQAQKWINMTLKYLFAMGESRVKGITKNYHHFHVPIDSIIMDKFQGFGIPKLEMPWSKIKDYDTYYSYQQLVRDTFKGKIPLDVEFKLFNQIG